MSKNTAINKQALRVGTAFIWGAVLIGASIFTDAGQNRALDWELMWVIIGGFLAQTIMLNVFIKDDEDKSSKASKN